MDAGGRIIIAYKHVDTRRYIYIERQTGDCYRYCDGDYAGIERGEAVRRALS